jgi:acyl-CoA synthetase (NDP forming)
MTADMRGIAVVGASSRNFWTRHVIRNIGRFGYAGQIWPVNPNYADVDGLPSVPSLSEADGRLDAVILAVAARRCLPFVIEAVERGCEDIVVVADGFAERGDAAGAELQAQLVAACGPTTRLYGPNGVGFADLTLRMCAIAEPVPESLHPGPVSVVSQSGALLSAMIGALHEDGLGVDWAASLGNAAQLDVARAIEYAAARKTTSIICLYAESLGAGPRISKALGLARDQGVQIVMLRPGRSDRARRIALSHTASVAGPDALADAFLRAHDVLRVDSLEELARTAAIAAVVGSKPHGPGVVVIGNSGGTAAVASELAARDGLQLATFGAPVAEAIHDFAAPGSFLENPLDLIGRPGARQSVDDLYETVASDPAVGAIVAPMVVTWPDESPGRENHRENMERVAKVCAATGTPALICSMAVIDWTDWVLGFRREHPEVGIVRGMDLTIRCLARIFPAADAPQPPVAAAPWNGTTVSAELSADPRVVGEITGREILQRLGLAIAPGVVCRTATEAAAAAGRLRAPFVVKVDVDGVAHKASIGAVRLGLTDLDAVATAAEDALAAVRAAGVEYDRIRGILVEEMATGTELLVGLTRSALGDFVTLGEGGREAGHGSLARTVLLPATDETLRVALSSVVGAELSASEGGRAAARLVSQLSAAFLDGPLTGYVTVELNPVFVSHEAATIADVLLIRRSDDEAS